MSDQGEKAQPPGYDAATRSASSSVYPKLITSTSSADGLEAYVEVDRVVRGFWGTQRATLLTLVMAHISPNDLRTSLTTLTISAAPNADTPSTSAVGGAATPRVMLHAPAFLRRPIPSPSGQSYTSFGVFAPAPLEGQDQKVVVKLADPLGSGLPDRVKVCLVVVHNDMPFIIKGAIRLRPLQPAMEISLAERIEEGTGALISPTDGPVSGFCSLCRKTMGKDGTVTGCSGLDGKHVGHDVWPYLVGCNSPGMTKWDHKENPHGDSVSCNWEVWMEC